MGEFQILQDGDWLTFAVRLQPRSSRNEIAGLLDGALKIRLTAPPVEDKANEQLVEFLARQLDIARSQVSLVSGRRAKNKRVAIRGLSEPELRNRITKYLV